MSEIFFTSDTHFGHDKEFLYGPRGFTSPIEMGEELVDRWNELVKPDDIVYHLGDFAMGAVSDPVFYNTILGQIKQLNGMILWIRGNHDSDKKIELICRECPNITRPIWASMIKNGKQHYYLSHYPTIAANFDDKHFSQHVITLHGHTHQRKNFLYPDNPFVYHIGVDSHDNYPVHIDEVLTDIRNRWNGITQLPGQGIQDPFFTRAYYALGDYVEKSLESQADTQP